MAGSVKQRTDALAAQIGPARTFIAPSKIRPPTAAAMPRDRLEATLADLDGYRLALVVAPAGAGKTTLLAQIAAAAAVPVAWYRAENWDTDEVSLVRHLAVALNHAVGGFGNAIESVDDLLTALDAAPRPRMALMIDDLHSLEGTRAEMALERLLEYAPPSLTVLAGSRVQPGFNLSRLRVSGGLVEIGADDLRFRPWEVDRLFRDHYLQQVPPQELAALTRRTEGWAAGLQLFHLATRSKSPDERRRILAGVAAGSRLTREYLARNVLGDLSDGLRRFLVETSVLGRLSGPLCDQLIGEANSRAVLEELERRQIFTTALDDDGAYRYHEVLRAHLIAMLIEERGEQAARELHVRAGGLLEKAGAFPEALSAYSRGEDWESVERVLGRTGEALVTRPAGWLDALPPSVVRHDPWLLLASARHARNAGRWTAALDAYLRAEKAFGSAEAASACRRERITLASWLEPMPTPAGDWSGVLRSATIRDPGAARRPPASLPRWGADLVSGLASLLAGQPIPAREPLAAAIDDEETPPGLAAAAALADGAALLLAGDARWAGRVDEAVEAAERIDVLWLARVGRAALALGRDRRPAEAAAAIAACRSDGDPWGEVLIELCRAWFATDCAEAALATQRAATTARTLGTGTLEAWARGLGALTAARTPVEGREASIAAETLARTVGAPGPRLLAFLALQRADPDRAHAYDDVVAELQGESGLATPGTGSAPGPIAGDGDPGHPTAPPTTSPGRQAGASSSAAETPPSGAISLGPEAVTITCLGGFSLRLGDRAIDLGQVKPRPRAVLRFLSIQAGSWVHREVITEALWPLGDRDGPARSLHVALSGLRRLLQPDLAGASSCLARDGDAYRLELPSGSSVDVLDLDAALAEARTARSARDTPRAGAALRRALELYRGDLLPEDGPATWAVEPRERARAQAVRAAQWLAELALSVGDSAEAVRACLAGLTADRYSDPLWRLLIEARDAAGDAGAAGRARREYELVLDALGVDADREIGRTPRSRPAIARPANGSSHASTNGQHPSTTADAPRPALPTPRSPISPPAVRP